MWHLVEVILMIFLKINWTKFVYLLVNPGFLSPFVPPKFLWSITLRPSIGWTPLTDTTDKQTNEVSLHICFVCLFTSYMEFDTYAHVSVPELDMGLWFARDIWRYRNVFWLIDLVHFSRPNPNPVHEYLVLNRTHELCATTYCNAVFRRGKTGPLNRDKA